MALGLHPRRMAVRVRHEVLNFLYIMEVFNTIWHYMCEYPIPSLGVWVVYKFQHFIWRKNPENPTEYGRYKTYDEARYKSLKKLHQEYPDQPVDIEDGLNDKNGKFFIFRILHTIVKIIIVPVKIDE